MEKNVENETIDVLRESIQIQNEIISSLKRNVQISEEIIELKDEINLIIQKQLDNSNKIVFINGIMWIVLLILSIIKIFM